MSALYPGLLLFALPHLFTSLLPATRAKLMASWGTGAYRGTYSLVSTIGVVLMIYAYWVTRGSGEMLYAPDGSMRHATIGLATIGMILISSIHGKSHIKLWLQNPFSIGLAAWATGHLLSVGKTAAVWIWGTILVVALIDIAASMARGKKPNFEPRWRSDIIAVIVGLILTLLLVTLFHPYVLGVHVAG
ncbi:NnrU family protein [Aestuariivirga litoralis]|uniref:NnrU family protein n=1 Tax=Aestuariivirga litoralis TaxID=2650924 RepID=UPI0018C60958|nr:NnrU family protein [Aestuariivirga litoralis]MBG1232145.1 hypothetical protein [Aestuariivirga litoralis]